ncbi:MAG: cbb3-type cytochrome c oxidase N-terminal domain-containing protein [Planctomycetota bacterium]|nr:cbb3-type cytochrome c oxidase N-terminal domain-containing protein [Planctomycetota bacterium]
MADQPHDVLTDHAYDGIEEYDNPMPGWWVWSFILSIIFAFPYWAWYHFADGRGVYAEHEADMERAAQLAPKLDESKQAMLGYLDNPEILAAGQQLFVAKCASCHLADGGGLVGPNMCDDNYNNIRSIEDIITVVRTGIAEKGMPAHELLLRQQQIVQVSAFTASLRGTTPATAKEPLGEPIPPWR